MEGSIKIPKIDSIPNNVPGESPIYRHQKFGKLNFPSKTLYHSFESSVLKYPQNKCLGWRPKQNSAYEWMSYKTLKDRSEDFGSGLILKGMTSV